MLRSSVHLHIRNAISTILATVIFSSGSYATEIEYRNFSELAAIGPPAGVFSSSLKKVTTKTLGETGAVQFSVLPKGTLIPSEFENIVAAVEAGKNAGGFDAAHVPALSMNPTWGFIYTSGIPFGPNFDEFSGFLFGKNIGNGKKSGLDLMNDIIERSGKNYVAIPIVGGSEQGSGYFMKPIGTVVNKPCDHKRGNISGEIKNGSVCRPYTNTNNKGIGLKGLCQKNWSIRYISPAREIIDQTCDSLLEKGIIHNKKLRFIDPTPGAGVYESMIAGDIQGFEVSTPLDDVSGLFSSPPINPGTVGAKYLHYPAWHQPFLITYMIINKEVWNSLSYAQRELTNLVGHNNVLQSYSESLRQQGDSLIAIISANDNTPTKRDDIVLTEWRKKDLRLLKQTTLSYLNSIDTDNKYSQLDRSDYTKVISSLREYVSTNNIYWRIRSVDSKFKYNNWVDSNGLPWNTPDN
jgi:TRAP-type mannitol/chloroaromatic compound transport system substrate-binding protein